MAGRGADPGEHRGGRKKGTLNKDTASLKALLDKTLPGWDPLLFLAFIARYGKVPTVKELSAGKPSVAKLQPDNAVPTPDRIACAREVAQYIHPKRKAVEVSGPDGGEIPVAVSKVVGEL